MRRYYIVDHRYRDEFGCIQTFEIGLFETIELAKSAVSGIRNKPGFKRYPDGFRIMEVALDMVQWSEGFSAEDCE